MQVETRCNECGGVLKSFYSAISVDSITIMVHKCKCLINNPPKSEQGNSKNSPATPVQQPQSKISALINKTLTELDQGCGPHIRDFIAELQKLSDNA